MLEFLHSHSSVVFQPGFDDPRYGGLNPYALGFAMMSDIKRICTDPTDRRTASGSRHRRQRQDPYGVLRDAWANYRDESFILQYMSPKIIRGSACSRSTTMRRSQHRCGSRRSTTRSAIAANPQRLSRQYDLSRREPDIQVVDVDLTGDRCLVLAHYVHDGVLLDEKSCRSVLRTPRCCGATRSSCSKSRRRPTRCSKPTKPATRSNTRQPRHPARERLRSPADDLVPASTACIERRPPLAAISAHEHPRHRDELRRDRGRGRRATAGARISAPISCSRSLAEHAPYGGVVPEIAARAHLDHLDGLIRAALDEAGARARRSRRRRRRRRTGADRRVDRRHDGGEGHRLGGRKTVCRGQPPRSARA
jgi:hypothetical protein